MRLQPARLGALHVFADGRDNRRVHALRGQLALRDKPLDRFDIDGAVDLAEQLGAFLRLLAVADRIDEQIAQRLTLEQLAEHVVDLAAERPARLLQLFEQAAIDLAFARVRRAQVPQVADLGLADAVDAAEALLQPVRVPRQVVVDHQMRAALQVDAFAGRVVRDHHAHDRIAVEGGDRGAAPLARDAAVDHARPHRRRRAEPRSFARDIRACP